MTLHVTSKYVDMSQYIFANSSDSMPANRSRESESRDSVAPGRVWTYSLTSHVVESRDLAQLQGSIDLLSDKLRSGSRDRAQQRVRPDLHA